MADLELISTIFEGSLIFLIAIFLLLILIKLAKGKSKLKILVFWIFFFIFLAFLLVFTSRLTYYRLNVETYPDLIARWFLLRIGWYRFSFALIIISSYFSYLLKEAIFDSNRNKGMYSFLILFGIGGITFALATPSTEAASDTYYHLGIFLIVFLFVFIVYIEFIIKSTKLFRHIERTDKTYRSAILSLIIMAYCFISAMLMFVFDRVLITEPYSVFYYLADVSILVGIIFAYFGYVKPKA
ncbi:MAG: hypothetical protein EU530_08425 [Promethearchaeota archaeon]|nr:MAG: hypothetical protein EU530_08425 [Candidatus Lokiarchaeota archaeon]